MQLLFGHDVAVARWASAKLNAPYVSVIGIGIIDLYGVLRGAALLEPWNRYTVEVSVYSEDAITPKVMKDFFVHVFGTLGIARLQMHTERTNRSMKKAAPKLGFKWDGVSKNFYGPNRDGLRYFMTPADCRWIERHGIETISAGTSGRNWHSKPAERPEHAEPATTAVLQSA